MVRNRGEMFLSTLQLLVSVNEESTVNATHKTIERSTTMQILWECGIQF